MPQYSIPRHIWRVLYPPLLFVGLICIGEYVEGFKLQWIYKFTIDIVGIIIFALMWRKIRLQLPKYKKTTPLIAVSVLTILVFFGCNYAIISVIDLFSSHEFLQLYKQLAQEMTVGELLIETLSSGIAAPIAEELVFRGIMLNRLKTWMPTWAAVLVGSTLFGVLHFDVQHSITAIFLGVAFSLLYIRYRNLWVPIVGHMSFNLATASLYVILRIQHLEIYGILFLILSLLVISASVTLLVKRTKSAALVQDPHAELEAAERECS